MAQLPDKRRLRQPDERPQEQRHAFHQRRQPHRVNSNANQHQALGQGGEEGQPDKYLEAFFHRAAGRKKQCQMAKFEGKEVKGPAENAYLFFPRPHQVR